jgi:hypothetical protein
MLANCSSWWKGVLDEGGWWRDATCFVYFEGELGSGLEVNKPEPGAR